MNKKILSLILILIAIFSAVSFRIYQTSLPSLNMQARQDIYSKEIEVISKTIDAKYPDMQASLKEALVSRIFKDKVKLEKVSLEAKIKNHSLELKSRYMDEKSRIFMCGIDSYYWLRLVNNLLDSGHVGDRIVNGVEYDDLIKNPVDRESRKNIHVWLGAIFYRVASFFNKDVALRSVVFWVPIFIYVLTVIFVFYLVQELGASMIGGFLGSITVSCAPFLVSRLTGEWFDTDIYNVLFPLLVFGIFVYAFGARSFKRKLLLSALSALVVGLYAATWKGWWFIFDITIISAGLFILNQHLSESNVNSGENKEHILTVACFFIVSAVFVILINGFSSFADFILEPLKLSKILNITPTSVWPNVYLTVAELGSIKPFEMVSVLGGNFIFFTGIIGLVYIFLVEGGSRDSRHGFGLWCLALWIISIFNPALKASRFVLLLVPPIGIAFGLSVDKILQLLDAGFQKFASYIPGIYKKILPACIYSLICLLVIVPLYKFEANSMNILPQMDKSWNNVLVKIKKETPPDAIINSWWDFGHWFKAISQRRVLFDGMTQNTPYAYWMARALITDNEIESVGILRMINSSGNQAAELLENKEKMAACDAVELIQKLCSLNKDDARKMLVSKVSKQSQDVLLTYIFPDNEKSVYFIVSSDMPHKLGPISYIGNWDFKKVDLWFQKKQLSESNFIAYCIKRYNLTKAEAEQRNLELYLLARDDEKKWFSSLWPQASSASPVTRRDNKFIFFENGVILNEETNGVYVVSEFKEKRGIPKNLFFIDKDKLRSVTQKDSSLPFSVLLVKDNDKLSSIFIDDLYAKSMMARLYYLKGDGLKSFKLWHKEEDGKGNAIYVYSVEF